MVISREEGIHTPAEAARRLKNVGDALGQTRSALRRVTSAKERMEPLAEAISTYRRTRELAETIQSLPDGSPKDELLLTHAQTIAEYEDALTMMRAHYIVSDQDILDFDIRYYKVGQEVNTWETRCQEEVDMYRRLKTLERGLLLADTRHRHMSKDKTPGHTKRGKSL